MQRFLTVFVFSSLLIVLVAALPTQTEESVAQKKNYASEASQLIALSLLKSNIDIDGNQVHSPLGVTSLLAVLAEAANGATYDQFLSVFGFPNERTALRDSFKRILSKYHSREYGLDPSFQTWLYIYRNNSANEEYKQILRDFYFVEVKEINREEYDWSEPNTSINLDSIIDAAPETTPENSKDVIGFETLKRLSVEEVVKPEDDNSDIFGEEMVNKVSSKFDRVVDEKQYVEKPAIIEELRQQQVTTKVEKVQSEKSEKLIEDFKSPEYVAAADIKPKEHSKREEDLNLIENEAVLAEEKSYKNDAEQLGPIQDVLKSNAPEKVSIPLQKLEIALNAASKGAGEIMIALESHLSAVRRLYGGRSLFQKDDITSALSANSITGRKAGSKTKMLIFNGLYYRGFWANAFFERGNGDEFFYMTNEDAVKMPMMHTRGSFHTANLEHLDAKVIFLPYQSPKYGMAIVLPKEVEGLRSLIDKLKIEDIKLSHAKCEKRELHVIIPKFQAEETSRSEAVLKGLGLTKLFSREEADLSLLASDSDLHVDELVQFVTIRVDEGGSGENALSATLTKGRTNEKDDMETFEVNRPFLYFILDNEENFVIASGKIYSPEYKVEEPITIEVEYEQS